MDRVDIYYNVDKAKKDAAKGRHLRTLSWDRRVVVAHELGHAYFQYARGQFDLLRVGLFDAVDDAFSLFFENADRAFRNLGHRNVHNDTPAPSSTPTPERASP